MALRKIKFWTFVLLLLLSWKKKNLVNSQSYLYHKLKVLTQCMCRYHFLLQCDNTDKVDQQIHIVYFGLW